VTRRSPSARTAGVWPGWRGRAGRRGSGEGGPPDGVTPRAGVAAPRSPHRSHPGSNRGEPLASWPQALGLDAGDDGPCLACGGWTGTSRNDGSRSRTTALRRAFPS
jgi:hypothetical protein